MVRLEKRLAAGSDRTAQKQETREGLHTKLYSFENTHAAPGAKRILISSNDPGPYGALKPLIEALIKNPFCKSVSALVSGVSAESFDTDFGSAFELIEGEGAEVLRSQSAHKKPDIILAANSTQAGPEALLLDIGKRELGAKKIFLLFEGYGTAGQTFDTHPEYQSGIDGVFCPDELGKELAMRSMPDMPPERFQVTGTPTLDALYVEDSAAVTSAAREKMGIADDEVALLFLGAPSSDYEQYGCDKDINVKTFQKTAASIAQTAAAEPKRRFVLMVRAHPRDPDKERLMDAARSFPFPKNARIVFAQGPGVSIEEARYAADAVMSIMSNENFYAPRLQRESIFLGYDDEGLGGTVIDTVYGAETVAAMEKANPKVKFARNSATVVERVRGLTRAPKKVEPPQKSHSSIERMTSAMFGS